MREMKSLTLGGETYDCFVDSVARTQAAWSAVVGSASGENIVVDDASKANLLGLRIYGKTTQEGTPTPDAPKELVSVGESGSITIDITGRNEEQSMTIATPEGLRGVPVASGGNYTDATGQQWICDEKDYDRGVSIQRTLKWVIDVSVVPTIVTGNNGGTVVVYQYSDVMKGMSTNRQPKMCDKLQAPSTPYPASYKDCKVGFWSFNSHTIDTPDIFLVFNLGEFSSVDEVVDHLQGNPLTFIGILQNPIETPLSAEEIAAYSVLHTHRDHTTVSNDASAHMELEYMMDAKKYIDGLMAGTILPATVE